MKVNVVKEKGCTRLLEVEIPVEEAEVERRKAVDELRKSALVPGFRIGKAPATLLERYYRKAVLQKVLANIVPASMERAMEDTGLRPIKETEVVKSDYDFGGPIHFSFRFEAMPDVAVKDYKGLAVEYEPMQFRDEMVEKEVQRSLALSAELAPVTGRPAEDGDFLYTEMTARVDGIDDPIHVSQAVFHLGEHSDEFLSSLVRDMAPGEERDFQVTFPQGYMDDRLAGKTAGVHATLNAVKSRKLPELDDEFAREHGGFQTVQEFRDGAEARIRMSVDAWNRKSLEQLILDKLAGENEFDVPDEMADRLFAQRARALVGDMEARGLSADDIKDADWKAFRQKDDAQLRRSLRGMLILDKIAEVEGVAVSDEELEAEIALVAGEAKKTVDEVKKGLVSEESAMADMKNGIRARKAMDILVQSAVVSGPPGPPQVEKSDPDACPGHQTE